MFRENDHFLDDRLSAYGDPFTEESIDEDPMDEETPPAPDKPADNPPATSSHCNVSRSPSLLRLPGDDPTAFIVYSPAKPYFPADIDRPVYPWRQSDGVEFSPAGYLSSLQGIFAGPCDGQDPESSIEEQPTYGSLDNPLFPILSRDSLSDASLQFPNSSGSSNSSRSTSPTTPLSWEKVDLLVPPVTITSLPPIAEKYVPMAKRLWGVPRASGATADRRADQFSFLLEKLRVCPRTSRQFRFCLDALIDFTKVRQGMPPKLPSFKNLIAAKSSRKTMMCTFIFPILSELDLERAAGLTEEQITQVRGGTYTNLPDLLEEMLSYLVGHSLHTFVDTCSFLYLLTDIRHNENCRFTYTSAKHASFTSTALLLKNADAYSELVKQEPVANEEERRHVHLFFTKAAEEFEPSSLALSLSSPHDDCSDVQSHHSTLESDVQSIKYLPNPFNLLSAPLPPPCLLETLDVQLPLPPNEAPQVWKEW